MPTGKGTNRRTIRKKVFFRQDCFCKLVSLGFLPHGAVFCHISAQRKITKAGCFCTIDFGLISRLKTDRKERGIPLTDGQCMFKHSWELKRTGVGEKGIDLM